MESQLLVKHPKAQRSDCRSLAYGYWEGPGFEEYGYVVSVSFAVAHVIIFKSPPLKKGY